MSGPSLHGAAVADYKRAMDLGGRGFVVLGAGQGIGEQTAHALSQYGAEVLCVDLDAERAEAVAGAVRGRACTADVTQRDDVGRVFAQADAALGARFAGIVDVVGMPVGKALADLDDADWARQFDLVVKHGYLALQHGVPLLARRGGGTIVFVGSIAGINARGGSLLAYGAAKAAQHHMVRSAAQEYAGAGVRVNAVAPGLTRTPRLVEANADAFWKAQQAQIPLGRAAETADIAGAILFLCTDLSRHMTGNIVAVDGGTCIGGGHQPAIARSTREADAPASS